MADLDVRYTRDGKCMDCGEGVTVVHYREGGKDKVWRWGCRCDGYSDPTNKAEIIAIVKEMPQVR